MRVRNRPLVWLLPLGLALGHALGAWLGDQTGSDGFVGWQGYFRFIGVAGVPLAAIGVHRLVMAGRTRRSVRLNPATLITLQVLAFLALEVGEHALLGISPLRLLTHPAIWIGVLAQVLVALLVAGAATAVVATAGALSRTKPPVVRGEAPPSMSAFSADHAIRWLLASGVSWRGPPQILSA